MQKKAFWVLVIAAILAGFSGPIIKQIDIPPIALTWIRTFVPVCLISIYFTFLKTNPFRGPYKKMILGSFLNAARMYLFFIAFIYASVSNAVVMIYTWPIFASIFGYLFLQETLGKRKIGLIFLAFGGIIMTYLHQDFSLESKEFIGMLAGLASALIYAVFIIVFKSGSENYTPAELVFYQNITGAILFMPSVFIIGIIPSGEEIMMASGYAIFIGILIFGMFFYSLKRLPASTTAMIMYVEVVSGILLGVFLLHEPFTWNMGVGAAMIVAATLFIRR